MTRSSPLKIVASFPASLLKGLIQIYRQLISPMLPPRCRYLPTCSEYALEAVEVHGALKGGFLALRRILRCHPIRFLGGSSGFDPVPPAVGFREKSPDHAQRDCQHDERPLHHGPHKPS